MSNTLIKKNTRIARRHTKIRSTISGTADMPRLSVFKSHRYVYVQLIDDVLGHTLASASSVDMTGKTQAEAALAVGQEIAKKAIAIGITKVVFDRSGYLYAGKVKLVADGARGGGLIF